MTDVTGIQRIPACLNSLLDGKHPVDHLSNNGCPCKALGVHDVWVIIVILRRIPIKGLDGISGSTGKRQADANSKIIDRRIHDGIPQCRRVGPTKGEGGLPSINCVEGL